MTAKLVQIPVCNVWGVTFMVTKGNVKPDLWKIMNDPRRKYVVVYTISGNPGYNPKYDMYLSLQDALKDALNSKPETVIHSRGRTKLDYRASVEKRTLKRISTGWSLSAIIGEFGVYENNSGLYNVQNYVLNKNKAYTLSRSGEIGKVLKHRM